jgi:predicted anti-sigma-YlaC factor YlaD
MTTHLTSKEIARWLVEGPDTASEAHLRDCWSCRAKLAEARAPIADFRTALMAWSEAQSLAAVGESAAAKLTLRERMNFMNWVPAFGLAVALAVVAAGLVAPVVFHNHATQQAHNVPSVSDAVLMDQVDEEVSEAVPDAMAPLTDLVGWDSSEGAATTPQKTAKPKSRTAAVHKAKANAAD